MPNRALRTLSITFAIIAALAVGLWAPLPAQAQAPTEEPGCGIDTAAALKWMATLQNGDGGFTNGFAPGSDLGTSADAVVAIVAAGGDLTAFTTKDGNDPLKYLTDQVTAKKADNAGKLGKVLAAAVAAKVKLEGVWESGVSEPLSSALVKDVDDTGYFGQALAILALEQAGLEAPPPAIDRLLTAQTEGGGWGFKAGDAPDTNTTALAIRALAAAEKTAPIKAALGYLRTIQNDDKGWPYQSPSQYGTDSDANSTALVIQAILAAGENLEDYGNPQDFLKTLQQKDGSFTFQLTQPAPSFLATAAVIPALCEAVATR